MTLRQSVDGLVLVSDSQEYALGATSFCFRARHADQKKKKVNEVNFIVKASFIKPSNYKDNYKFCQYNK